MIVATALSWWAAAVVVAVMMVLPAGLASAVPVMPMTAAVSPASPVVVGTLIPAVIRMAMALMAPVHTRLARVVVIILEILIDLVEDLSQGQGDGLDPRCKVIGEVLSEELEALGQLDTGLHLC